MYKLIKTFSMLFCFCYATGVHPASAAWPNDGSTIGTNLAGVCDYSRQIPFVNLAKQARWWGKLGEAWTGLPASDVAATGYLKPGKKGSTIIIEGADHWPGKGCNYVITWSGTGTITVDGFTPISSGANRIEFTVPTNVNRGLYLNLTSNSTTNPVSNIWVGEKRYEGKTDIFYDYFISNVANFKVFRVMDWNQTNGSNVVNWYNGTGNWNPANIGGTNDFSYAFKNVPPSVIVALCNKIHADLWLCMPHKASNAYIDSYASYVKSNLTSDLKVYIEYTNEVWNSFSQGSYCESEGLRLNLDTNPYSARIKYQSKRSVEIFDRWYTKWSGSTGRLIRVMAGQASNDWVASTLLSYNSNYLKTDAVAIAPYFGDYLGSGGGNCSAAAPATTMSTQQVLDACLSHINGDVKTWMTRHKTLTNSYKNSAGATLKLTAYEGGQHLVGVCGNENNSNLNTVFDEANRHSTIKSHYLTYLNNWKNAGGGMFCHFVDCTEYEKHGRWGAKEYRGATRSESPKFDALLSFMNKSSEMENGATNFSEAPEAENTPSTLRVYPNPTSENIVVTFMSNCEGEALVNIFTLTGSLVYRTKILRRTGNNEIDVNLLDLQSGTYCISITGIDNPQYELLIIE